MADKPLTRGDRAPNFFLADHRDIIISLNDKVKGGPIVIFFYPTRADKEAATEFDCFLKLADAFAKAADHSAQAEYNHMARGEYENALKFYEANAQRVQEPGIRKKWDQLHSYAKNKLQQLLNKLGQE